MKIDGISKMLFQKTLLKFALKIQVYKNFLKHLYLSITVHLINFGNIYAIFENLN